MELFSPPFWTCLNQVHFDFTSSQSSRNLAAVLYFGNGSSEGRTSDFGSKNIQEQDKGNDGNTDVETPGRAEIVDYCSSD